MQAGGNASGEREGGDAPPMRVQFCGEFVVMVGDERIEQRRRELADLELDVLESVAQVGLRLGGSELAAAERAARRLIELAPLRETGHVILMETQAARGNRGEALRTFELLRARLRDEL